MHLTVTVQIPPPQPPPRVRSRRAEGEESATRLPGPGTATPSFPACFPACPHSRSRSTRSSDNASPAVRGVVALHSLHDGELLALFDSASLTAWRTGLTAALATDALAVPDATSVAFVGAGAQATVVLLGLCRSGS